MARWRPVAIRAIVALVTAVVTQAGASAGSQTAPAQRLSGRRLALVIGNAAYPPPLRLTNPKNDATDVDAALQAVRFETTLKIDVTNRVLREAIDQFVSQIRPGDVALLYYSGHGMQVQSENYLLPVDFSLDANADQRTIEEAVYKTAYSVQLLHDRIARQGASLRIVILDACRTDPTKTTRGGVLATRQGLAAMHSADTGSFFAFAAAENAVAYDNSQQRNSNFTAFLVKALAEPGLTLHQVFMRVGAGVKDASKGAQIPWVSSSFYENFYFRDPLPNPALPTEEETQRFVSLKDSASVEAYRDFLRRYPNSIYGQAATALMEKMIRAQPVVDSDRPVAKSLSPVAEQTAKCSAGSLQACSDLADRYTLGDGVAKDIAQAESLYSKACDGRIADACAGLGFLYVSGDGIPRDAAKARPLFERACVGDSPMGCFNLALLAWDGDGMPADHARAVALFKKVCDADVRPDACAMLGYAYVQGDSVPKDVAKGAALLKKACDGDSGMACMALAETYIDGGAPDDVPRAIALIERACDLHLAEACNSLAESLETGDEFVKKDEVRAAALFGRACDSDHGEACRSLGGMYADGRGVPKDLARAATLYQKACDADSAGGCFDTGWAYGHGEGVARDPARAAVLYQRACEAGYATGCTSLGYALGRGDGLAKDAALAAAYYKRGCDGGSSNGCFDLALYYFNGTGVSQDRLAAAKYFEIACDAKDADGCMSVGRIFADGLGVKKDSARARTFFARACTLGDQEGCRLKHP